MNAIQDVMAPVVYRIEKIRRETHDTRTLELKDIANGALSFLPGQFNMLYVFGMGEIPVSISGDPAKPDTLLHTIRGVGPVSDAALRLKPGSALGIRGPFGNHWPLNESAGSDVVIIAGGIGLAPLRPALYALLLNREKFGKIVLLYGARTPEDILFRVELERWRSRLDLDVTVTLDHATSEWRGNVGFVTAMIHRAHFAPEHAVAFVCGPEVMMRYSAMELLKRGMEEQNIYISMERNMKCAVGFCGHCQFGPVFVCKDGPVFPFAQIGSWLAKGEI